MHEADQPDALGDFPEADVLAGEDCAEVDLAAPEAQAAALSDRESAIVERILQLRQARIRAR